jgi:hypothetical protein
LALRRPQQSFIALALLLALAVGSWPLWTSGWTLSGEWHFFFAAGIAAIASLVVVFYAKHKEALSTLPLVAVFYVLTFVVGSLYYRTTRSSVEGHASGALGGFLGTYTVDGLARGTGLALIGFCFLILGWFFVGREFTGWADWCKRIPAPRITAESALPVAVLLLAVGWLARAVKVATGGYFYFSDVARDTTATSSSNLIGIVADLPLVAFGVLYATGKLKGMWFWALLACEAAWAIPSGQRSQLVALIVMLIVLRYYGSPKPIRAVPILVALFITVFVIFPFGAAYKQSGDIQHSSGASLQAATETVATRSPADTVNAGVEETVSRFSGAASLGALMSEGRNRYPRDADSQVTTWLSAFVPRALLPGKTDPGAIGNEFGRSYGILATDQVNTASIAPTQIGDFWGPFGWWGPTLGLFLVGMILRGFDTYFSARRTDPARLAVYAVVITGLVMGQESTFAVGVLQPLKEVFLDMLVLTAISWLVALRLTRGEVASARP